MSRLLVFPSNRFPSIIPGNAKSGGLLDRNSEQNVICGCVGLFNLMVVFVSLSGDGAVNQLAGLGQFVYSDTNCLGLDSEFKELCTRSLHLSSRAKL